MGEHFQRGRPDNVPERIDHGQIKTIAVRNRNWSLRGVKGILKYKVVGQRDGVYMTMYFENLFLGHCYHNIQFSNDEVSDYDLYVRIPKSDSIDFGTTDWHDCVYGASSMTGGRNSAMGIGLSSGISHMEVRYIEIIAYV